MNVQKNSLGCDLVKELEIVMGKGGEEHCSSIFFFGMVGTLTGGPSAALTLGATGSRRV